MDLWETLKIQTIPYCPWPPKVHVHLSMPKSLHSSSRDSKILIVPTLLKVQLQNLLGDSRQLQMWAHVKIKKKLHTSKTQCGTGTEYTKGKNEVTERRDRTKDWKPAWPIFSSNASCLASRMLCWDVGSHPMALLVAGSIATLIGWLCMLPAASLGRRSTLLAALTFWGLQGSFNYHSCARCHLGLHAGTLTLPHTVWPSRFSF
jgi:hypothetical protein